MFYEIKLTMKMIQFSSKMKHQFSNKKKNRFLERCLQEMRNTNIEYNFYLNNHHIPTTKSAF